MLEAPTTLLLTSGLPIQHVLGSGKIVDLPNDITFICEISNAVLGALSRSDKVCCYRCNPCFRIFLYATIHYSILWTHKSLRWWIHRNDLHIYRAVYTTIFRVPSLYLWFRYGAYCRILRFRSGRNSGYKNSHIRYNRQTLLKKLTL